MVMLCFFYDTKGPREIMQLLQSGKGIVIVITVVFSCLSFTLGFFVGKFGTPRRPETTAVSPEPQVQPPALVQSGAPQQSPQPPEPGKAQTELLVAPAQLQPAPAEPPARPSLPPQGNPSPEPRIEREVIARQVKEVSKATLPENKQLNTHDSPQPKKEDSAESLYSVQLGAFRNKAEATKFRAKYSKKGYKIYMDTVKTDNKVTTYKLRTGEFREKKDAEVLAVKLKKTESLKTFVVTISK
ncbi:MAG: hypothetical protein C0402_00110 [Thermodesulfovibrio sp.]|nr:hypothetical protein [Thermodesulfovibrio sp.]